MLCMSTPTSSFFFLSKILFSEDAKGIKQAIELSFEKRLSDVLRNLVFLSSDGTATNSGLVDGLITLFREDMPWVAFAGVVFFPPS